MCVSVCIVKCDCVCVFLAMDMDELMTKIATLLDAKLDERLGSSAEGGIKAFTPTLDGAKARVPETERKAMTDGKDSVAVGTTSTDINNATPPALKTTNNEESVGKEVNDDKENDDDKKQENAVGEDDGADSDSSDGEEWEGWPVEDFVLFICGANHTVVADFEFITRNNPSQRGPIVGEAKTREEIAQWVRQYYCDIKVTPAHLRYHGIGDHEGTCARFYSLRLFRSPRLLPPLGPLDDTWKATDGKWIHVNEFIRQRALCSKAQGWIQEIFGLERQPQGTDKPAADATETLTVAVEAMVAIAQQMQASNAARAPKEPVARPIDPGKYDGKDFAEAEPWYERMLDWREKYPSMTDEQFLSHLTDRLAGSSRKWFTDRRKLATAAGKAPFVSLQEFKMLFLKHHRVGNSRSTARSKLLTLTQKRPGSVATLHEQFLTLVADVPYISIDERCFLFVQALKPKIRSQLKLTPHWLKLEGDELALQGTMEDFNEFVRLAFECETALQEADSGVERANDQSRFYRRAKAPRINAVRQSLMEKIKARISPAEREQRFRDRACLACGDKTHRLRDCPSALARELRTNAVSLSAMDAMDDEVDELCLNAIAEVEGNEITSETASDAEIDSDDNEEATLE